MYIYVVIVNERLTVSSVSYYLVNIRYILIENCDASCKI